MTDILNNLPTIVSRGGNLSDYTLSHNEETQAVSDKASDAIIAHQVANATGDDLDRLGALFGEAGDRRGMSDDDVYRSYLQSVVEAFSGRGSVYGVKSAIALATGANKSDVVLTEDFSNHSYSIDIYNTTTNFTASDVEELAEIADPSGVELTGVTIH